MQLLEGKVAIITGSGRGIGAEAAQLFAAHGAKVVVSDLDPTPAEETAHIITNAGGNAIALKTDVTNDEDITNLIQSTVNHYGGVDILVNNAGYTWDGMIHKMTDEQWLAMINVHLTAPFKIIRAAIPFMRDVAKQEIEVSGNTKARKIVNVSSTTGTRGNVGQTNYSAGKAGIIGLTKTLSKEWGAFNIQVNAVAFGFIDTRLTRPGELGDATEREGQNIKLGIPDKVRQNLFSTIPMKRPGTATEAAGALLFFSSELSNYVSGQVLEVAGGM